MLEVKNVKAGYDSVTIVHDASFNIKEGTIVALLGTNGSGKTTLLRAITGAIPITDGSITFMGKSIVGMKSHDLVKLGISMVPEGRHLFGKLSVRDNLLMGAYLTKDKQEIQNRLDMVYELLPVVEKRSKQYAQTLTSGEQQMVAIGRGLMSNPKLLILDEPSLGLMPKLVGEIFEFITKISDVGKTILMVEQNATAALEMCDYGYVLKNGETVIEGSGQVLLADENIKKAYLGG